MITNFDDFCTWMYVTAEFGSNFVNSFTTTNGFQCNFGLEVGTEHFTLYFGHFNSLFCSKMV